MNGKKVRDLEAECGQLRERVAELEEEKELVLRNHYKSNARSLQIEEKLEKRISELEHRSRTNRFADPDC